jgi:chaperonin cofactor prefoldin
MLDRLLGRAALRDRIEDLETQLRTCRERAQSLEQQYDAADRREKEAVRDYQEAQEQLNRARDRIAQLEDRVDQLSTADDEIEFRETTSLRGRHLEAVLDRLESVRAPPDKALTAVIESDIPDAVREAFGTRAPLVGRASPCLALTDADGLVSVALRPPIRPEATVSWNGSFDLDRSWFLPTGEFALALVRADLFALGAYRGTERLSVQTFETEVGRNHSKGGFSQGRFERRRNELIDEHLTRCEEALRDRSPERLLVAGDSAALDALDVDALASVPVDASGDPESALDEAFRDVWTTQLYCL